MNMLSQLENGIFATEDSLKALEQKEKVKILVLSDSHGAKDLAYSVISNYAKDCDALIFAGDGSYDVIYAIEKLSSKKKKSVLPPVTVLVRGNNDASSYGNIKIPEKILLKTGTKTILVTHGAKEHVYYGFDFLQESALLYGANAVIFGHTHVPSESLQKVYILNPGSISCPRNFSKPSFGILEINKNDIYTVFYKIEGISNFSAIPYFPQPFFGF